MARLVLRRASGVAREATAARQKLEQPEDRPQPAVGLQPAPFVPGQPRRLSERVRWIDAVQPRREVLDVMYHGKNIFDMLEMTVNQAIEFFGEHGDRKIVNRLRPLQDVGLGYISLGQSATTLSGVLGATYRRKTLLHRKMCLTL